MAAADQTRWRRLVGVAGTEQDYRRLASEHQGQFLPCHAEGLMVYDIVGPPVCHQVMRHHRLAGLRFRYFYAHLERLGELQSRIDAVRSRRGR